MLYMYRAVIIEFIKMARTLLDRRVTGAQAQATQTPLSSFIYRGRQAPGLFQQAL